jgi:hypothetical protein
MCHLQILTSESSTFNGRSLREAVVSIPTSLHSNRPELHVVKAKNSRLIFGFPSIPDLTRALYQVGSNLSLTHTVSLSLSLLLTPRGQGLHLRRQFDIFLIIIERIF